MDEKEYYINSSRAYFRFLIQSGQWSGFGEKELNSWIKNFDSMEDGEYIACKLLNECIGYSEKDVISMLKGKIKELLFREIILPYQLQTSFSLLNSDMEYMLREEIENTLFVPLSVNDVPGESGEAMIRLLTQELGNMIHKQYSFEILEDAPYKRIIIIDDCIGSGQQFKEFWEEKQIKCGKLFRQWCKEKGIKVCYIAIIGYEKALNELERIFNDVQILCVEILKDQHKVLDKLDNEDNTFLFSDKLEKYIKDYRIGLLGFNQMQFAVFIHRNIPDWSLPVFYKSRDDWHPLLRRKDSDE